MAVVFLPHPDRSVPGRHQLCVSLRQGLPRPGLPHWVGGDGIRHNRMRGGGGVNARDLKGME